MKRYIRISLFAFLILFPFILKAQSPRFFTPDSHLSSSLIKKIFCSSDGYVWIATEDGLNKFDGSKIITYKNIKDDSTSLAHNFVNDIFEDKAHRIYVSTYNGLQLYDAKHETFSPVALNSNGVPHHTSTSTLVQKSNGEIWVFGNQVLKVDNTEARLELKHLNLPTEVNQANVAIEDYDGSMWIAHDKRGIYRISPQKTIKHYYGKEGDPLFTSFVLGRDNVLYAGTAGNGLYRYDRIKDIFEPLSFSPSDAFLNIMDLYCNEDGLIYIATDGTGMKSFNPDTGFYSDITLPISNSQRLKVHSITKDIYGNLWVAVYQKGVAMLPYIENDFKTLVSASFDPNIIGNSCVTSICHDSNNNLWIGTDNDGIYAVQQDTWKSKHFSGEGMPKVILGLFEDNKGQLWIASYDKGVGTLDKTSGKFHKIPLVDENGIECNRTNDIIQGNKDIIYFATMGSGLFSYNTVSREILRDSTFNSNLNQWVTSLEYSSQDNAIYIGTYDGLYRFDKENKLEKLNDAVIIYSIYQDTKRNCTWLATASGLYQVNNNGDTIKTYQARDGLPSSTLYSIEDDGENLWISTNSGLSRFNIESATFTNFYYDDGLQSNEFFKKASFFDKNSSLMYFGGINGVSFFNPFKIAETGRKYDLRITDFYVGGQPIRAGVKSGSHDIINEPISEANTFHLSHDDNSFSVEFNVKQFACSSQTTFLYSFDNKEWETLPRKSVSMLSNGGVLLTFSNVESGKHVLLIKAVDNGVESTPLKINIDIDKAWYQTWWAKSVYVILFLIGACLVFVIVRRKTHERQLERARIHAEEIKESKLQFFTNISHEIRTPLSLVISPLKKLMNEKGLSEEACQKEYRTMNRNANRILRLVNEIMDLRKIDNHQMKMKFQKVCLRGFIEDLYETFSNAARVKNLTFQFDCTGCEDLEAYIDLSNFDKIVMNLLSNAIKYTPANGSVVTILSKGEDLSENGPLRHYVQLSVIDTGIGIPVEERAKVFDRFYQVVNNNSSGTGIGLHLTHTLVKMHHGSITIEDNPTGNGTCFIVRIPLGKDHLKKEEIIENETHINTEMREHAREMLAEETETPNTESTSESGRRTKNIYIVEDDADVRNYLFENLNKDYRVSTYHSGESAFEAMCKKIPDLLISDVMMPGLDGLSLTRKIRQNVNLNHIPIILLTAKSRDTDNIEGLDAGADLYMTKPFNIEILEKNVKNLIVGHQRLRNVYSGQQSQTDKVEEIQAVSSDDKLMERVMMVINKHLSDSEITVEMIAEEIGISRVHLHRKLKELTNQTTRDFIRNLRLQQAAKLLREKKLMVAEVCYLVGFKHPNNFSSNFKEMFGMSPSAYADQFHAPQT